MAHVPSKLDVKLAPKLIKNSLTLTGKVLARIGKPLYLLLFYSIVAVLFVAYWSSHLVQRIDQARFVKPKIKRPSLPKFKFRKLKVDFKIILSSFLASLNKQVKFFIFYLSKSRLLFKRRVKEASKVKLPELKRATGLLVLRAKLRIISKLSFKPKIETTFLRAPLVKLPAIRARYLLALLILLTFFVVPITFWRVVLRDLPSPRQLVTRKQEVSTKIYDRNGVLLYKIYKDQNRTLVALDQIPLHVRLATLAIEDAEFYSHPGFSLKGIIRATIRNIGEGELTGGSTITQQLVKNALLTSEKTVVRKLREIILAIGVEFTFSKDRILEMYLNEVSYGGTAYGIQEASRVYFDKNVDKLTLAEAALLAALPKSPTRFSPFGSNPQLAFARQKKVLDLMAINGYITKKQAEDAKKEEMTFAPNRTVIKAPHFVTYVRQALAEKYGEEVVEKGGLKVITTLDWRIQKMAEQVVKDQIGKLASLNVGNGAALVIRPQTGEILAMVGSKDYFDTENDGNVNVTTRPRQPGSSIKIVNYAYALSNGYTAATILSDTPVTFAVAGQPPYTPSNYDGGYRGKLSLRSALAESRNIPAVKVLASYGVNQMLQMGQKMGITTWNDTERFGLSLTLGGGEVTLLDLAKAYATIANYGRRPDFVSVRKVTNYGGRVIEEHRCEEAIQKNQMDKIADVFASKTFASQVSSGLAEGSLLTCKGEQVLDPRVAYLLTDILRDNTARAPAFGSHSFLVIPNHTDVAVKTGTSNNLRDNLTIGFNQKYLVAVWVGNNDNSPMNRIASGVTGATPIFNEVMSRLLAKEENHPWPAPNGLVQLPICTLTGTLACEGCPTRLEWFLEGTQPTKACSLEQIIEKEGKEKKKEKSGGRILEPAARTER